MKKIMFNDKYGLTDAVLEGRKTMTRRIIKSVNVVQSLNEIEEDGDINCSDTQIVINRFSRYQPGEVVAVTQSYNDSGWNPNTLQQTFVKEPTVFPDLDPISPLSGWIDLPLKYHRGWSNKMFVYAGLMPHQIRITNVRVERLQDISDDDCIREGIKEVPFTQYSWTDNEKMALFDTPRDAFAALIDKVSGKGTWESNPWVFVYEYELER